MRRKYMYWLSITGLILAVLPAFAGQARGAWKSADSDAGPAPAVAPSAAVPGKEASKTLRRSERLTSSSSAVRVSGISIQSGPNGETYVNVSTTRPAVYRVLELKNPPRLVVDFEGARQSLGRHAYPAQSLLLAGVRVGQFRAQNPAVVRVVADLMGDPVFDVHAQPGGVRIELKSRSLAGQPAVPAAEPSKLPAQTTEAVKTAQVAAPNSTENDPKDSHGVAVPAAKNEPASSSEGGKGEEPATSARLNYQNALPAALDTKELAAAPRVEAPAPTPEAVRAANAAKILAGSAEADSQTQSQPAATAAAPEGPKYSGEPTSVNLKDVDLKDFFRLIHELSGLNIIIDPNVTGSVTLILDSVPWDQALDIVLKNNQLGKTMEGNVLRIARLDTLMAEQEAASKLAAAKEEAQPLVTRFVPINYAKAATISTLLKGWVGGGALSKRGSILLDDRTNTLIISDIASQIPVILPIIEKLDTKAKQVQIEARILMASTSFTRTLGIQIASIIKALNNPSAQTNVSAGSGPGAVIDTTGVLSTGITQSVGLGGIIAVHNASTKYSVDALVSAAESKNLAKTISKPMIVTQNNILGTVVQGTQIPIQTTVNFTPTTTLFNAALTLQVTPQVTADGNVFLIINITNNSPGQIFANGNPGIDTESATTQVLVPDGGEVIFGGVTINSRKNGATYVPIIGSIPIIGHLFKTTTRADNDTQLLFFVSPKILPG